MPIEGEHRIGPELVPIIRNGKRAIVTRDRLNPYDLGSAQTLVESVGRTLAVAGGIDPPLYQAMIDHVAEFARAADEVIAAGRRELDRIQGKQSQIHGEEAKAKYGEAIDRLRVVIDRHVRMKCRLQNMLHRARTALARAQREKRNAAKVPAHLSPFS